MASVLESASTNLPQLQALRISPSNKPLSNGGAKQLMSTQESPSSPPITKLPPECALPPHQNGSGSYEECGGLLSKSSCSEHVAMKCSANGLTKQKNYNVPNGMCV